MARTRPDAGFCNQAELPKGPNGRALCRYCSCECPKGRRSFCSDDCVHEWKIRSQPAYARQQVFKRDHGKCAICAEAATAVRRNSRYGCNVTVKVWEMDHIVPVVEGGGECGLDNLRTLCPPCHRKVTAELTRRRAAARRTQLALPLPKGAA